MNKYEAKMKTLPGFYYLGNGKVSAQEIPVKKEDVQAVEEFMQCELPKDYLEFVSKYGGYGPDSAIFPIEPYSGGSSGSIGVFSGIGHREGYNLLEDCKDYRGRVPAHLLPIAENGMGSLICLSLTGPDTGYVYFWDHHEDSGEDPPDTSNLHLIAKSFDAFIESLRHEEA
jgi:hypothetical protein